MAEKPETRLKNRIRPKLEALRFTSIIKIQQVCLVGDPDFVMCVAGRSVYIEMKRNRKEKAERIQYHKLAKHVSNGGYSFIMHPDNALQIVEFLEELGTSISNGRGGIAVPDHLQLEEPKWLKSLKDS